MAFKFVAFFALLAVSNAGLLPAVQVHHAVPATVVKTIAPVEQHYANQHVLAKTDEDFDPHPQYHFGYKVQDSHSGDSKSQVEERDGDVVRGEYSLIDADGYKRTVKYTADDNNGFNAVVEREPLVKTIATDSAVVKTLAPVTHYAAAPAVVKTIAPIAHYAAPVAQYTAPAVVKTLTPVAHYTAPVSHYDAPTVVKTVAPIAHYASEGVVKTAHYTAPVAHYNAPTVIKTLSPVAHYASPAVAHYDTPAYTSYSAPPHYVAHH